MNLLDVVFNTGEQYYSSVPKSFDWQSFIQTLMACSITALGFILAYRIYKNRDVKKTITLKQVEAVSMLAWEIEKSEINVLALVDGRQYKWRIPFFFLVNEMRENKNLSYYKTKQIIFTEGIRSRMTFSKFYHHPFCPSSIAEEIGKLYYFRYEYRKKENIITDNDFVIVYHEDEDSKISYRELLKNIEAEKLYTSEHLQSIENYLNQIQRIKIAIAEWLRQFNIDSLNLKLDDLEIESHDPK